NLAQRRLLRQQAMLLEDAFDRARRQQRTLDEVVNAVTFGVVSYDKSGRPTIVNRAHRDRMRRFGYSEGDVVPEFVYGADRTTPFPLEERPYRRLMRGESFDDVVLWYGDPGGYREALAITGRPLRDAEGRQDGAVWVSRDIT